MAHVNPDSFVFFAGTSPEVDAAGAGGGGVVIREFIDAVDERDGALVNVAFFAFI